MYTTVPTSMMTFAVTTGGTTDDTVAATPIVVSCEASAAVKLNVPPPPLASPIARPITPALAVDMTDASVLSTTYCTVMQGLHTRFHGSLNSVSG